MFATKGRLKVALLVVVSLLTIGLVGNFHPLLLENAEAHGGRIRQWTETRTGTAVYSWKKVRDIYGTCSQCSCYVYGEKRQDILKDYTVTACYFDDGHYVYWEPCTGGWVSGTEKDGSTYNSWDWSSHIHGACNKT